MKRPSYKRGEAKPLADDFVSSHADAPEQTPHAQVGGGSFGNIVLPLSERIRERRAGWLPQQTVTRNADGKLTELDLNWLADEVAALEQERSNAKGAALVWRDEVERLRAKVCALHEIRFTYYGGCKCDDCKAHRALTKPVGEG